MFRSLSAWSPAAANALLAAFFLCLRLGLPTPLDESRAGLVMQLEFLVIHSLVFAQAAGASSGVDEWTRQPRAMALFGTLYFGALACAEASGVYRAPRVLGFLREFAKGGRPD